MLMKHKIVLLITILIIAIAGFTVYATASPRVYNYKIYAVEYSFGVYPTQYFRYLYPYAGVTNVSSYILVIKGAPGGPIVVDMGFEPWVADILLPLQPPYARYVAPAEALANSGVVDPAEVKKVILTHMHWDHAGACYPPGEFPFPNAKFYIQEKEWETAMYTVLDDPWLLEHAYHLSSLTYTYFYRPAWLALQDHVELVDGEVEIMPGIRVMRLGGHTPGHQIVIVSTKEGAAVISSDLLYFYFNLEEPWPIGWFWNLEEVRFGAHKIEELATSGIIFAGHDPEVLERYPSGIEGVAVAP